MHELDQKIEKIRSKIKAVDSLALQSYLDAFRIEYTHHSTAIEGNTLSLIETKVILEDGLSIGGKLLREIHEVENHDKAYQYLHSIVHEQPLTENIVKELHSIVMKDIIVGGIYRNHAVRITGAGFKPPVGFELQRDLQNFYADFSWKCKEHPIEFAAWTHAEFVRIHPFSDGNGRTARLLMNYQLVRAGYLPVIVNVGDRERYYTALDRYATEGGLADFTELVYELEMRQVKEYLELLEIG